MSRKRSGEHDPYKRWPTRYPGISYRERCDGSRTYYVANGSRHLRVDGGEQEALLVQADLRSKRARGLRVTPLPTTFRTVAEAWFTRGCARWRLSTQKGYRTALDKHILPVFGTVPVGTITTDGIATFIAMRIASGAAESYVAANLRPLNGALKLALRDGLITANPMTALLPEERPKPAKRRRRTWTPTMIADLIAATRARGARRGNVYDYTPLLITSIYTGIRPSELLGLRWLELDLTEGAIRVRHQLCRTTKTLVPPKTPAAVRDVPIPDSLIGFLRSYRLASRFSQDEHFVFCSKQGSPLDEQNVNDRGIKPAIEAAGLNRPGEPDLTWYDLRHAYASVVAHHGIAAVDFAVFMGHEDARVTEQTYIHPYNELATAARLREVVGAAISEHIADSA